MHVFCLTRGPTRSWRNRDAQFCQLGNIADPFSGFFSFKKAPKPYLVSENRRYCDASKRFCCPSAHTPLSRSLSVRQLSSACTHLSLALSLCICSVSVQRAAEMSSALIQLNTDINNYVACFSNFTCKCSQNHSTAIVFILCVFHFIRRRLDYQDLCAD